jgi:hypothetical protein
MNITKELFTGRIIKVVFFCLFASCSKDPLPSTITVDLGQNVTFDATEEQIVRIDADSLNIEFEIVSIENTLCPEGSRCVFMGSAILGFKLINNIHELITLSFPSNEIITDSAQFSINANQYYIKLQSVKKVYYNDRKTKTKTIVDLKIESI